jgi:hypothetical protein
MLKGHVTAVDGLAITIKVDDDVETRVGVERGHTKLTITGDKDENVSEAKFPVPGRGTTDAPAVVGRDQLGYKTAAIADVKPGDLIEVRGANPLKADSIRVVRGGAKDVKAVADFNARKAVVPQTVQVTNKKDDAPRLLPAETLSTADQAPADVPYGERRKWREAEAKKAGKGQEVVSQDEDADDDAGDHVDNAALKDMTKADLEKLAESEGIELKGSTKDEYVNDIKAGRRKAARAK